MPIFEFECILFVICILLLPHEYDLIRILSNLQPFGIKVGYVVPAKLEVLVVHLLKVVAATTNLLTWLCTKEYILCVTYARTD